MSPETQIILGILIISVCSFAMGFTIRGMIK